MKKRFPSFLAGVVSALLLAALCTTALAASGKISYNFASVSINGQRRIAAGEDLAVGEGKHIPGSILYTDESGGKTNYLPVRTIAELLGVEVDYDAATQTVLLRTGAAQAPQASPTAKSAGLWKVVTEDGFLTYTCEAERKEHDTLPAFRPAALPEDWKLEETRGIGGGNSSSWRFDAGEGGWVSFQCSYPGTGRFSNGSFEDLETVVKNKRQVTVQGYEANLYTERQRHRDCSLLAWENSEGVLFHLTGADVPEDTLLRVAESIQPVPAQTDSWQMRWLPEGSVPLERSVLGDTVQETQLVKGTNVTLLASPLSLAVSEEGQGEAVQVHDREARFWAAREPMVPRETKTTTAGDVTITSGVVSGYGAADLNTLLWDDPDTGTRFRLLSGLDRETMLRVAENVMK